MIKQIVIASLLLTFLCCLPNASSAELYLGIGPLDNLSDLKARFPNATFTKENPAWAQDHDVMYTVSGAGLSGTLVVKFNDSYAKWKKQVEAESDEEKKRLMKELPHPVENNELISWVRWIPDTPFPVTRLMTKYGKPDVTDFSPDDFTPYKEWKKRGLLASLTDDGKKVVKIDFTFTNKERDEAMKRKYGFDFSKETKAKKKGKL